jgi:urea transport system permease protein
MSEATSVAAAAAAPPLPALTASRPSPALALLRAAGVALFLSALFVPGTYYATDKYWLPQFTRFMALALFALSVDLVWGYTGLLSLGQGLYFGLGAYAAGYSLKLQSAALEVDKPFVAAPDMALPDFMEYCRLKAVPGWIQPLIDIRLALVLAVLVPAVVAALFGSLTFWRRIKGVFFALITQALLLAVFTLVVTQQPYTGGVVGMTKLAKLQLFGYKFQYHDLVTLHPFGHELKISPIYCLVTGVLAVSFLGCLALVRSKFGRILTAIRDSEYRVLALGYNTAAYKTFVFALAGALAGLAGALYVSAIGTAGPDRFSMLFSIEVVIWVAVGGRGTLFGPVLGTLLVMFANTYFNNENIKAWATLVLLVSVLAAVLAAVGLTRRLGRLPRALVCLGAALVALAVARYYVLPRWGPRLIDYFKLDDKPAWPILLGLMFILVVVFLREGVVGGAGSLAAWLRRLALAPRKEGV